MNQIGMVIFEVVMRARNSKYKCNKPL